MSSAVSDIDRMIEKNREKMRVLETLDTGNPAEIGIQDIMADIRLVAETLDTYVPQKAVPVVLQQQNNVPPIVALIKKLEAKHKRGGVWGKMLRPFAASTYHRLYPSRVVDGQMLMQYQDRDFVEALYRSLLLREPDPEGFEKYVKLLRLGAVTQLDMIYNFLQSPEGLSQGIAVKGLTAKRLLHQTKKAVYKIPLIGYLARELMALLFLPVRLRHLLQRIGENFESIKLISEHSAELDAIVNRLDGERAEHSARLEAIERTLSEWTDIRLEAIEETLSKLVEERGKLNGIIHTVVRLEQLSAQTEIRLAEMENGAIRFEQKYLQVCEQRSAIQAIERSLEAFKSKLDTELDYLGFKVSKMPERPSVVVNPVQPEYPPIQYFQFENTFRGSRHLIKQRQAMYIPYFQGKSHVLDIGCGRGEFLELLKEQNIPATGVDSYSEFVDYCTYKGLTAVQADALAYVDALPEAAVDGIFMAQVAEHLSTDVLRHLCACAYQKLALGGHLVMETPNPTSLVTFAYSFYVDPSHSKPVHPETLCYFLREAGFTSIELIFTDVSKPDQQIPMIESNAIANIVAVNGAISDLNRLIYGSQDYAVVAKK